MTEPHGWNALDTSLGFPWYLVAALTCMHSSSVEIHS